MKYLLFTGAPAATFRRAAMPQLQSLVGGRADDVWRATLAWRSELAKTRPRHTMSVNMLVRLMEWGCALYKALRDHGITTEEAGPIVEKVLWDIFQTMPKIMFAFSRLASARTGRRVAWILGIITRHFFTAPFNHRHLPSKEGVSFDVLVCPLADYYTSQGVPELTPYGACNLDFGMARHWGVELERTQTIAGGAAFCDFRWKLPEAEAAAPEEA